MNILTSKGFRHFDGVICNGVKETHKITIDNNSLRCTDDHRVNVGGWRHANTFEQSDPTHELVYDAVNVDDGHEYLTNNIPSHNCIYIDEMAFIQNDVEFFESTYPVISSGKTTKVLITSTPNGMNLFYKIYHDSKQGRNLFVHKEFLWHHHPERDERWKEETLRNIGEKQFAQEYECEFMGSSDTLISGAKLQQLTHIDYLESNNNVTVYEYPNPNDTYVACVDVSEGIGKDYSVCSIFNVSTVPYKQALIYRTNVVPPDMLTTMVHQLCTRYNNAYTVVESNSIGKIVADSLYYEHEYENMLTTKNKMNENIISEASANIGIKTTKKTKNIGCSSLKTMIEGNTLLLSDFTTISEISTFVQRGTSFQAENNKNDDIVMTLVMFAWFVNQPYFADLMDVNIRDIIKSNYMRSEDNNHLIFGFMNDGIEEEDFGAALF